MQEKTTLTLRHTASRVLHTYADVRIGATKAEKHCHKTSDTVLLTFDDYGTPEEMNDLLNILADKGVKAMFFVIGSWADEHPELVAQIAAAGHELGNHTYSHPNLLRLSDAAILEEVDKGIRSRWLRAPQGRSNRHISRLLREQRGMALCYWTIDSRDWTGASVAEMRHTIMHEAKPGAVVLFHMHGTYTRQLLPGLIDELRSSGHHLTDMTEQW